MAKKEKTVSFRVELETWERIQGVIVREDRVESDVLRRLLQGGLVAYQENGALKDSGRGRGGSVKKTKAR